MEVFGRTDLPIVFQAGEAEIRSQEVGEMTVSFYRLPAGVDGRPLLEGLPGDACHCPHWGYVISGRLRIHTTDAANDVAAGQAFYVEPGHAPEALEDTEMVEGLPEPRVARGLGASSASPWRFPTLIAVVKQGHDRRWCNGRMLKVGCSQLTAGQSLDDRSCMAARARLGPSGLPVVLG